MSYRGKSSRSKPLSHCRQKASWYSLNFGSIVAYTDNVNTSLGQRSRDQGLCLQAQTSSLFGFVGNTEALLSLAKEQPLRELEADGRGARKAKRPED